MCLTSVSHISIRNTYGGVAGTPVAQTVKNLPAMQETRVQFLAWEVPLEKGVAIHSSVLAGRIPWTEKPGGLQSVGSQKNWTRVSKNTNVNSTDWRP